jgi:phosphoglycerate kinase
MRPVASRLSEILETDVFTADSCVGDRVEEQVNQLDPGQILLLENVRFHPEEEKNDPKFAKRLAKLADIFVNDAFRTAHRSHASTEGVAHYLLSYAGLLVERELAMLGGSLENPDKPLAAIFGGKKLSCKISALERLGKTADFLLIGGAVSATFFKAQGREIGQSFFEQKSLQAAENVMFEMGEKMILPVDVVISPSFKPGSEVRTVPVADIHPEWRIMDIGPQTRDLFVRKLASARTVVWNGPLGVSEITPFDRGTLAIIGALSELEAKTLIGGEDTIAVLRQSGLAQRMTHVSTGDGAFLAFVAGQELPAIKALEKGAPGKPIP